MEITDLGVVKEPVLNSVDPLRSGSCKLVLFQRTCSNHVDGDDPAFCAV